VRRAQEEHEFSVHWVPRRTVVCDRVLAEEGVAGDVVAEDYPLAWVPLDSDLLSLELPSAFQVRQLSCPELLCFVRAHAVHVWPLLDDHDTSSSRHRAWST